MLKKQKIESFFSVTGFGKIFAEALVTTISGQFGTLQETCYTSIDE